MNRGMGKTPASCNASRQAQTISSWLGAHLWRYHGRALEIEGTRVAGLVHEPRGARVRSVDSSTGTWLVSSIACSGGIILP